MFDLTISLGTIIQTITIVGSAAYFIWKLQLRLEIMDTKQTNTIEKITAIERELEKLTDVIIEQAKHSSRLDNFELRLQEISNRLFQKVHN